MTYFGQLVHLIDNFLDIQSISLHKIRIKYLITKYFITFESQTV